MRYFLVTLGCPKNQVDSDFLVTRLRESGWKKVEDPAEADLVVVNTCSFIVPAVEESVETILEMAEARRDLGILLVAGCLVSRYGKGTLARLLPEVDLFLSPTEYAQVIPILRDCLRHKAGVLSRKRSAGCPATPLNSPDIAGREAEAKVSLRRTHSSTLNRGYVYVKVSEGCHRRCAYCAIPRIRGHLVSRPVEEIVAEAAFFIRRGAREIVLVGQDTTSYGKDIGGRGCLHLLLKELCSLKGDFRIRVMYMHPEGVDDALLEAMHHPKVYPYFDLPFQHVDQEVLRAMGRKGDADRFRGLVDAIRQEFPGAALRATFMVGFPGEDAASFRRLYRFVEQARFDWLGIFGYSQEEGTPAYPLGGGCSPRVKLERLRRLSSLQEEIMRENARRMVGKVLKVLVEGESDEAPGYWEARSYREAPEVDGVVFVTWDEGLKPGKWRQVRVVTEEGIDLIAVPVTRGTRKAKIRR
ncbi:MAG: 30S ribosomal protein S12 methylthiotransferase RimO [Actinomycetota bacterium]